MNILFSMSDYSMLTDANSIIIDKVISQLLQNGHKIYIVEEKNNSSIKPTLQQANISIIQVRLPFKRIIHQAYTRISNTTRSVTNYIKLCSSHPIEMMLLFMHTKIGIFNYSTIYKKAIVRIARKVNIQIGIAIVNPIYAATALSKADNISKKKIVFFDDYIQSSKKSKRSFIKMNNNLNGMLTHIDSIYAVDFIFPTFYSYLNKLNKTKIKSIFLPNVYYRESDQECNIHFEADKIHFLYTGALYPNLREPNSTLDIFLNLPLNFYVHFASFGMDETLFRYKSLLGNRLMLYGRVKPSIANTLAERSTFLLLIDNIDSNQIPSKLFDYISVGKPIIYVTSRANRNILNILEKYKMFFILDSSIYDTTTNASRLIEFCFRSQGIKMDFEQIKEEFSLHTPEEFIKSVILSEDR